MKVRFPILISSILLVSSLVQAECGDLSKIGWKEIHPQVRESMKSTVKNLGLPPEAVDIRVALRDFEMALALMSESPTQFVLHLEKAAEALRYFMELDQNLNLLPSTFNDAVSAVFLNAKAQNRILIYSSYFTNVDAKRIALYRDRKEAIQWLIDNRWLYSKDRRGKINDASTLKAYLKAIEDNEAALANEAHEQGLTYPLSN